MLFRQLFERESSTYTYLLAAQRGGEALRIDPVKAEVEKHLQLIKELNLRLVSRSTRMFIPPLLLHS